MAETRRIRSAGRHRLCHRCVADRGCLRLEAHHLGAGHVGNGDARRARHVAGEQHVDIEGDMLADDRAFLGVQGGADDRNGGESRRRLLCPRGAASRRSVKARAARQPRLTQASEKKT